MSLGKEDIMEVALEGYYTSPKMVKFLLAENLALKTILHKQGLLDPEDFKEAQIDAMVKLDNQAKKDLAKMFSRSEPSAS